jgi:hypothetical protein
MPVALLFLARLWRRDALLVELPGEEIEETFCKFQQTPGSFEEVIP